MPKQEVVTHPLPMPESLEPRVTARTLMTQVRVYFYTLYNAANGTFRGFLASVGNSDSITGNRFFDRYKAVEMVKAEAKERNDSFVIQAKEGDIYKCIVRLLRQHEMGLRVRRAEYRRLTSAAE